jgi:hypothetical protein
MPNNYDFSTFGKDLKTLQLYDVEGWTSPLYVEYAIDLYGGVPSYYWRVKGTKHTFVIPVLRMDFLSKGDYEAHFKEALSGFRKDYQEWAESGFVHEWMHEYREQYKDFISL